MSHSSQPALRDMTVPALDLKAQFAALKPEIMPVLEAVLDSQYLINGPAVRQLEEAVAAYCQCPAAVGVSSGTDALVVSLMALGIGPGDQVITSPYTFFATAGSISRVGATPVFVDIDPATFNIDPALIPAAVSAKTKAIMPVHLFGQTADMDPILAVARKHHLAVIEDACQTIGATYHGRPACALGTLGCLSFYPTKNLGGAGDAGMVVTSDKALAERLAIFRNHGMQPRYHHKWIGGNFRLDTLQAAYLLVKLKHLDGWSEQRRLHAAHYHQLLAPVAAVTVPQIAAGNVSIFNQYVIRVPRRDGLKAYLKSRGIDTEIYYPVSLHEQECFKSLGYKKGDFPNSESAAAESLALPIFPELTAAQVEYVAGAVRAFFAEKHL
jgi:dTDP-4-amino-4,6-dideoxygalactose transaminase